MKSRITYFSDLFIAVMVMAWIVVLAVQLPTAVYSTVVLHDNEIWTSLTDCTTVPLAAGGAIWMIKNSVQHAIANNRGERAHEDFPAVEEAEFSGSEHPEGPEDSEEDGGTDEDEGSAG